MQPQPGSVAPSYPSPVSKTGHTAHAASALHCFWVLGSLAAGETRCSQEGVMHDRRAQSQQMGVIQIGCQTLAIGDAVDMETQRAPGVKKWPPH
ncbi:hypothetical protein M440DRAFT_1146721 [Trichoderma longibrachiatum ATCC 18648]|uniref:Uncharacterized protein n=1 Tax=Trichoderma longibrachiatum ATCC 18648 TaxID=983965 RepID=A0A2T4BQB0_TRILO|nr:hypothetical protein M440DRAFT_1146721 [Trichoderma longibrachiatum ATCC 18648]